MHMDIVEKYFWPGLEKYNHPPVSIHFDLGWQRKMRHSKIIVSNPLQCKYLHIVPHIV